MYKRKEPFGNSCAAKKSFPVCVHIDEESITPTRTRIGAFDYRDQQQKYGGTFSNPLSLW